MFDSVLGLKRLFRFYSRQYLQRSFTSAICWTFCVAKFGGDLGVFTRAEVALVGTRLGFCGDHCNDGGLAIIGYWKWSLAIVILSFLLFLASYLIKSIKVKGYSIDKLLQKINEIPRRIHNKNNFLALCRYLAFSHQYYFLFLAFDVDLPYITMMATIATVYFLASSLPSFQFLDFAVKGSVAVYFFGILGVNEWIVVFISTLMWFLNVVLPVVIGSYYVMNFKIKTEQ